VECREQRRRETHRRLVWRTLTEILNDASVMPNIDCSDLIVSIRRLEFGQSLRTIYLDVYGRFRWATMRGDAGRIWMERARAVGQETFDDLTGVMVFPRLREIVARELKSRLRLPYLPKIEPFEAAIGGSMNHVALKQEFY
jgi:hypothetical protein